jgi:hypothetical protein
MLRTNRILADRSKSLLAAAKPRRGSPPGYSYRQRVLLVYAIAEFEAVEIPDAPCC